MGALTAAARVELDESQPVTKIQVATSTDGDPFNFYRGAFLFFNDDSDHLLTRENVADAIFAGICDEQLVTDTFNSNAAAAGKLVFLVTYARVKLANSSFTQANIGKFFACTAGSDNPEDLVVWNPGSTTGCVGVLDQVSEEGVSGYLNLTRRISVTALPT